MTTQDHRQGRRDADEGRGAYVARHVARNREVAAERERAAEELYQKDVKDFHANPAWDEKAADYAKRHGCSLREAEIALHPRYDPDNWRLRVLKPSLRHTTPLVLSVEDIEAYAKETGQDYGDALVELGETPGVELGDF